MGFGGLLKIQLRYGAIAYIGFCMVAMTTSSAEAAGGSWGSSLGGFASRGGIGSGGGLLAGRAPVRNLLGRLNSRVANLGGGSRGGLLSGGLLVGRSNGGLIGGGSIGNGRILDGRRGGLLGIRNGGSAGGYYGGSTGSYSYSCVGSAHILAYATAISAPSYVAAAPAATSYVIPSYDVPNYDYSSFSVASPSNYVMEQSYPVGDYGFEPGYPIQQYSSPMDMGFPMESFPLSGSGVGGGFPVEGAVIGGGVLSGDSLDSPTILDGGSIDSMLDTGGFNGGLDLNTLTPAGGSEYYDGLGPGDDPSPPTGDSGLPGPASEDGTFIDQRSKDTKAVLNLVLPEDAKVLINGKVTTTRGALRSYISRRLLDDRDYKYEVRAIVNRNGKETVRTKLVTMRPGIDQTVNLDFDNTVTTLALNVPADAKVKLCGKSTEQTGAYRSYTTSSLAEGKTWKSYTVRVEYVVGGKKRIEERTLDLQAGQEHELAIGVDATDSQIAAW